MRGVGVSHGAITIVNALPTGIGCAAGITVPVTAEISLEPAANFRLNVDLASDTRLVRQTVSAALDRWGAGRPYTVGLRVHSEIAPSKGLKSSSAVPVAIARAVTSALGIRIAAGDAAQFAADVAGTTKLSATGAFDDALAGAVGGFVVTDNSHRTVLRHEPAPARWRAVLWIPPGTHHPSVDWIEPFRAVAVEGEVAARRAQDGDYAAAMNRNTQTVERVMGYDYEALHATLREAGAVASGVSGMGPTVVAISREERVPAVLAAFPVTLGERRVVEFLSLQGDRLSVTP